MSKGARQPLAWLAADVHGDGVFLAAAGGLARLRAWLATDGHGGEVFLAAVRGLAHLWAWLTDEYGGDVYFAAAGGLAHLKALEKTSARGSWLRQKPCQEFILIAAAVSFLRSLKL
jgi:hypothetical protein